jgi:hypothetical protein
VGQLVPHTTQRERGGGWGHMINEGSDGPSMKKKTI